MSRCKYVKYSASWENKSVVSWHPLRIVVLSDKFSGTWFNRCLRIRSGDESADRPRIASELLVKSLDCEKVVGTGGGGKTRYYPGSGTTETLS